LKVTESPRYLRHRGRPLVSVWGIGFPDRPASAAQAAALIDWFHNNPNPKYRATVKAGVPTDWRTQTGWTSVYHQYDVISPWTVGRFTNVAGADNYKATLVADLADARANGVDFMPVVFPGFSWFELNNGPKNQIPRQGGQLYWRQIYNAISAGSTMIYGAMFDEVDEGTAMFAVSPTQATQPAQAYFLPLDADGYKLPSDWYLRLGGYVGRTLHGEMPLQSTMPLVPTR
jgi:hypothetical protein